MKKGILALLIALVVILKPVFALEHLNKDDLKITVEGLKSSYSPGDKVNVTITIEPKSDDIAKKMENREYDIYNMLKYPSTDVEIYASGLTTPLQISGGDKVVIPDYYLNLPEDEQLEKIVIKVLGYVPSVSEDKGIVEFTYLKVEPQDGDILYFNLTILNPSKLSGDLNRIKNEVKDLEAQINELCKYVNAESLKDELNKIKTNLSLAEGYYNDHDYEKVSEKISWLEKAIKDLKEKIVKMWAEYYVDTTKNYMNDIDALILKATSFIDVAKSAGKTKEIIPYELNVTQIKYNVEDLKNELQDIQSLYDNGKYNDTIDKAKDLLNKEKKVKLELSMIVDELQNIINAKPTPTPTKGFGFKLDKKTLEYIGVGIGVIVIGGAVAVAISRWRQKRKWDELR